MAMNGILDYCDPEDYAKGLARAHYELMLAISRASRGLVRIENTTATTSSQEKDNGMIYEMYTKPPKAAAPAKAVAPSKGKTPIPVLLERAKASGAISGQIWADAIRLVCIDRVTDDTMYAARLIQHHDRDFYNTYAMGGK